MIFPVCRERQAGDTRDATRGYAMAALLVTIGIMSAVMSVALPAWSHMAKREKEAELVFRGEQYARAVGLYQRKVAGAFPPSVELLLEQRFLRRAYRDPMVENGEFRILYQTSAVGVPGATGQEEADSAASARPAEGAFGSETTAGARGGIVGVVSRSEDSSLLQYNGRDRYDEWQFVYTDVSNQLGAPGAATPGQTVPQPDGSPGAVPGGFDGPGTQPRGGPGSGSGPPGAPPQ